MKTAHLISWQGSANSSVFHSAFHYNIEILKTSRCTHTARAYLHSKSMKHKGSFTPPSPTTIPHPHQDGMLYVVHHSFAPCSMPSVNTKSKKCEERSSFLSKKIKWQHRKGSNHSSPNPESAALPTPGDSYTCITNQPAWISQKERDCCQLSQARWPVASLWHDWGPWKFFQLICVEY